MTTSRAKVETIVLGRGIFNWPRTERVSDRYGLVGLYEDDKAFRISEDCRKHLGKRGRLVAVILETRQSGHIGDFFRGIFPSTPNVGDKFTLGEGTLFETVIGGGWFYGLKPDEERESDWLDPHILYRCHDQTVELTFEPEPVR